MANQKNARRRTATAKKKAENIPDSPLSRHTSTSRPKPRPTGKAAIRDPKPSRAKPSRDSDASMVDDSDAAGGDYNATVTGEDDQVIEEDEYDICDDQHEYEEEEDVAEVNQPKGTASGM